MSSHKQGNYALILEQPGTYTLLIEGRVFDTVPGSYTFNVLRIETVPIPALPKKGVVLLALLLLPARGWIAKASMGVRAGRW